MGAGASGEAEQRAQILKSQCAQHRGEHTVSCSHIGELGCSGQGILSHGQGQGVFQEQKKFTDGFDSPVYISKTQLCPPRIYF